MANDDIDVVVVCDGLHWQIPVHEIVVASFCQRPEDSSFDLVDEGDYNPRKEGKHKTRRYRAKKDSILDVTEVVPSLLKCVSGCTLLGRCVRKKGKRGQQAAVGDIDLSPDNPGMSLEQSQNFFL